MALSGTVYRLASSVSDILRGFRSTGDRNFHFLIDFAGHRYNRAAAIAQPVIIRW